MNCPHCNGSFAVRVYRKHIDTCLKAPGAMDAILERIRELSDGKYIVASRAYDNLRGDLPCVTSLTNGGYKWKDIANLLGLEMAPNAKKNNIPAALINSIGEENDRLTRESYQAIREWPIEGRLKRKCYWDWRIHEYRITDLYELR